MPRQEQQLYLYAQAEHPWKMQPQTPANSVISTTALMQAIADMKYTYARELVASVTY